MVFGNIFQMKVELFYKTVYGLDVIQLMHKTWFEEKRKHTRNSSYLDKLKLNVKNN